MYDTCIVFIFCNDQLRDIVFSHPVEGVNRQGISLNCFWVDAHDVLCCCMDDVIPFFQHSPQVTICDYACQHTIIIQYCS